MAAVKLSPALQRKAGQRINALEGSRILEKFVNKPSTLEDEEESDEGEEIAGCGFVSVIICVCG